jgi:hypothetical protein
MYIPVPGTPGLWRLRLFLAGIAPTDPQNQAAIQAIQQRIFSSLKLSPQFMQLWKQGFQHSMELMLSNRCEARSHHDRYNADSFHA